MAKTVTFQTVLDPTRETAKAYKVFGGDYLPKSQVTFVPEFFELRRTGVRTKTLTKVAPAWVGQVTMPEWLARR